MPALLRPVYQRVAVERSEPQGSDSPWDDADRRPSHANRRKALRQQIMQNELTKLKAQWWLPRKITQLTEKLLAMAA